MRFAACLLVVFGCLPVFASDPGQPLDCSDWVFYEPGHTCEVMDEGLWSAQGTNRFVDNNGQIMNCDHGRIYRVGPVQFAPVGEAIFRTDPNGSVHVFSGTTEPCGASCTDVSLPNACWFDAINGYIYIPGWNTCGGFPQPAVCGYTRSPRVFRIGGFTPLFEILQTYTPPSSLGFRVPYMPEGMAAADHFDTYWGAIANPIDFRQAHPLQCDYPSTPPHVGDYLTVADPLPDPAPGTGRYYFTAATHQGQRRYGRRAMSGQLSGRDPAVLPGCGQQIGTNGQ